MAIQGEIYNKFSNEWYKLAYNESFSLLNKDGEVFVVLPKELHKWKIRIVFESNVNIVPYPVKTEIANDIIVFRLINWYSDTGVYNTEPILLNSQDGKFSIFAVIKSIANRTQNHRSLMISIWEKHQK